MSEPVRDERWKNVNARISMPQGYFFEDERQQFNPFNLTEFLIEVRHGENVFYARQIVDNRELEEFRLRTYQFVLDMMVDMIDEYMSKAV